MWQQGTGSYRDLTWGSGIFAAVSSDGHTGLTSADGITWTDRQVGMTKELRSIAYGNGLWFAVGQTGRIAYCTSLNPWQSNYYSGVSDFRFIQFVRDRFFLATANSLLWVTNASTVHVITGVPSAPSINSLAYGNGRYVGVGDYGSVIVSTNGTDWAETQVDTSPPGDADNIKRAFQAIVFVNGYFVAAGPPGRLFVSTDAAIQTVGRGCVNPRRND